ncbi:hypothetical protein C8035_v003062 [Colletotrichum spinosum]|uniref:Heterokaryon incompatibility domain-containing protein n=1 Tax=Colletotrichum spinosum TaxID=1347390 RepID=A0A4R8PVM5_9PEZI|nr:hypothetical protein C8035_v003062 [Colletotrichum spinosum]
MPTRLVRVTEPVQLVESNSIDPSHYVALSHCWGQLADNESFCLFRNNYFRLQESIIFDRLPRTFRDAIAVTRGLGIEYIWIDSLCIIQDDARDWESEASKMEEVFSAAYCTISAASAQSSLDGFLSPRSHRPCVRLQTLESETIYVCPHIDDFHRDVELAEINRRGWVLQERALSRRSIYYTSTQLYWECGEGIQCETLSRLYNSKAAFLGDANFPRSALDYYRDGRLLLVQDLFEKYSALAFTVPSDRAVAILGLQKRLARAFKTQAAYACFESYFARSILWMRDREHGAEMKSINQPPSRHIPSWSWLSKVGKIQFMDLTFEKIEWMTGDFQSPFAQQMDVQSGLSTLTSATCTTVLRGLAKDLAMTREELGSFVKFDHEQELDAELFRAVAIGRDKGDETTGSTDESKYH